MLTRRDLGEMMDRPELHPGLLAEDLRNLEALNRLFGGRSIIRRRVLPLLDRLPPGEPVTVLDIGSGAGDLAREIVEGGRRRGRSLRLYSLDFHPEIQAYARQRCGNDYPEIRFLQGDARRVPLRDASVDLAVCTLTLHHFADRDAAVVLGEMRRVSRRWAVASDLRRGLVAWAAVWFATRFTRNPMTRHDGPASVRRAFTPEELASLAREAGWPARVYREPWFRMSIVYARELPWSRSS